MAGEVARVLISAWVQFYRINVICRQTRIMWYRKEKIDFESLKRAEIALGIQLPDFFWDFYRNEARLIRKLRVVSKDADYIFLTTDFDWMIKHNRDLLQLPRTDGICRNKICIGTDGCGNDSFISLTGDDERVFFIDHEMAGELIDHDLNDFKWEDEELDKFDSLKAYVKYQIRMYQEL